MIDRKVEVWEQEIEIPTYSVGKPNKNPMFLEKRVYQGSSGRVYPHSVIDKIYDEKINKTYQALFIENKYLKVMILPELGGRIQRAVDKTNNYDFIYYNQVIKPALVGLAGPWISGGIEFNWPQHHRPSTFDPVDYKISENKDGSCTVWLSEIENMFRTKGMIGITLYPDKAYIEISAQLYNRTNTAQTFLWWANPAVAAHEETQSIFPPDVYAVMDHGKRDVSTFPIATGTYYKMDYSAGVDISRYKNIPVPTSYMVYHSDYDFVGSYDYEKNAGVLHVADHHISPGKKQWTWGCGEFGKAWDRNLTDEDGPYIELMTGCFTDNQPDFAWMMPYEEKSFKQYFMPYKGVGRIKNATIHAAVNMEIEDDKLQIKAYVTEVYRGTNITIYNNNTIFWKDTLDLSPEKAFELELELQSKVAFTDLEIVLSDQEGNKLVSYKPMEEEQQPVPDPAEEMPLPKEVSTNEELYLCGLHLEQYRHATYEAADYYLEGLRRDDSDYRLNTAYGKLLLSRGCFKESEGYLRKAVQKLTKFNPNPYDGEALYYLGLSLKYQGKNGEAYEAFYKATWNGAYEEGGFYHLACLAYQRGEYELALDHIERALIRNSHNMKARNLKAALLRHLGRIEEAKGIISETQRIDPLDFNSMNEMILLEANKESKEQRIKKFNELLHDNHNTSIELAIDYIESGMYREAQEILIRHIGEKKSREEGVYPLIYYYIGYIESLVGNLEEAQRNVMKAEKMCSDYCFPHRLEDLIVLTRAAQLNPSGAKAYYYLGNLWYDKKQYEKAIEAFETSKALDHAFPTVHRNLALAYYNKIQEPLKARLELEKAFELDSTDFRVFMELDQLYKKIGVAPEERLQVMESHLECVEERDDVYLEYITLLNTVGFHEKARDYLMKRKFHPWEGGEGKVPAQYLLSHIEIAKKMMESKELEGAIEILEKLTGSYPTQLGEGKLQGAGENHIYYYLGCAYKQIGNDTKAKICFQKASEGLSEPVGMMYYNDQPPEMIFYQGMALLKLGEHTKAKSRFNKLINYGKKHLFDNVKIDYFAVSLPDLQIFEEDLNKKNKVHCYFMIALGLLGLGEKEEADQYFNKVVELDKNHLGARLYRNWR